MLYWPGRSKRTRYCVRSSTCGPCRTWRRICTIPTSHSMRARTQSTDSTKKMRFKVIMSFVPVNCVLREPPILRQAEPFLHPWYNPMPNPLSLQNCMCPACLQILFCHSLAQRPDNGEDLLVMIPQPRLRICVCCR